MESVEIVGYKEIPESMFEYEFNTIKGEYYLDHAGAALYSRSQIDNVKKDLSEHLYSNPHANSFSGKQCLDTIDQVRYRILDHFNTDIDEYSVIFTSGATESLKLVAETFDFNHDNVSKELLNQTCRGTFAYVQDNHTSVLGMREVVTQRGATLQCIQHDEMFVLMNSHQDQVCEWESTNTEKSNNTSRDESSVNEDVPPSVNSLFVMAAQCNFSGLKYPLSWIEKCHKGALSKNDLISGKSEKWFCLLDAAAFVSTNKLDLSLYKPDFVCLSFYKIFGYPTGLGVLLVNKRASEYLKKCYYGGGTVVVALSSRPFHVKRPQLHERFEDGTLNFLSIVSLLHGFEALQRLAGDMEVISAHCFALARHLHQKLLRLHHSNGKPAVVIYCDTDFSDATLQGAIVNFNVLRHSGEFVGYAEVQALASLHNIHIRTGCSCNPGACQRHLKLSDNQLEYHYQQGHVCGDDIDLVNGYPTGSIRISFGYYSKLSDADKIVKLIEDCFVSKPIIYKERDNWDQVSKCLMRKFLPGNSSKIKELCNNKMTVISDQVLNVRTWAPLNLVHIIGVTEKSDTVVANNHQMQTDCDQITLTRVFVYPIKSCGSLVLQNGSWLIDSRGLQYDRQWMIVTASGVALTQKKEPRLCLIRPLISSDYEFLILTAPGKENCFVPINMNDPNSTTSDIGLCQSKICGDRVKTVDCGNSVAQWLFDLLSIPNIRLVKQSVDDNRMIRKSTPQRNDAASLPNNKALSSLVTLNLSNQAQFLLVNMSTVRWLADKLPLDSDCDKNNLLLRFRCNFVIDCQSLEPFIEQKWSEVKIGEEVFKVIGPCRRCQMICIDQNTGQLTKEPLTTLAAALGGRLQFGIYLQHIWNGDDCNRPVDSGELDVYIRKVHLGDTVCCYNSV